MINKSVPYVLILSLLSYQNIYATNPHRKYPRMVFLPKQNENWEKRSQWQNNTLPQSNPPTGKDSNFNVELGWKLNKTLRQSNEWRIAVNVKY